MSDYPVQVEVASPPHYDRLQLLLRLILAIVLGWLGATSGWLVCLLYGALPLIAAIAVSSAATSEYSQHIAPRLWSVLAWLLSLSAYMLLLTDRFPAGDGTSPQLELRVTGSPTLGSALSRLVTSIPSGLVLGLLWCVSSVLSVVAVVTILFARTVPVSILGFQRGVLRWQARLVAYHASLVEEYPPFSFDTHGDHDASLASARTL